MTDTAMVKELRRPTASLKRLATVEAIFGYIMVPFCVFLQYVSQSRGRKATASKGQLKDSLPRG